MAEFPGRYNIQTDLVFLKIIDEICEEWTHGS
jgi:hypothetical protein